MNYEKVHKNEQSFRLLTSLTREEFAYLLPTFETALRNKLQRASTHDKKVADEVSLNLPKNSYLWTDSGFDGYQNSNANLIQSYKKRRGKELGIEQLHHNYMIGQFRVINENAIGGMKRCNIIAQQRKTREQDIHTKHLLLARGCTIYEFFIERKMSGIVRALI
jgi:hypothetical protein